MADVATISTNAGDVDWRVGARKLEWAVWHARQIGLVVPTEVEAAVSMLNGTAQITTYSTIGGKPFILCAGPLETDQDFDDEMAIIHLAYAVLKRRRQRALEERPMVIGYDWPPSPIAGA